MSLISLFLAGVDIPLLCRRSALPGRRGSNGRLRTASRLFGLLIRPFAESVCMQARRWKRLRLRRLQSVAAVRASLSVHALRCSHRRASCAKRRRFPCFGSGGHARSVFALEDEQAKAATKQVQGDRGGGSGAITRCESRVTVSRCQAEASLLLLRLPSTWVRGARKRGKRGHRNNR
jgi:hypothetical protein